MEEIKGQDILNFIKELPNDEACKAYLAKIKWQDGFTCNKCSHTKGCEKSGYTYHCYSILCKKYNNKVKRVYIRAIDDYSAKSLTPIFEEHISTSAKIITDKWRGYEPLKQTYDIQQIYSNNGANFKQLHIIIMQVKSWIRAIPTHVSKSHIQAYFDEFCFRINRSQFKNSIFHKTIMTMVEAKPLYQNQIKQNLNV